MGQQHICVDVDIQAGINEVFETIAEHERFGRLLDSKMTCIVEGKDSRNGVGSVRTISIPPLPMFEETITAFEPNQLIEYKITKGGPVKNHVGTIRFTDNGESTHINYQIAFDPKLPLTGGLIKAALKNGISKGLNKYAKSKQN